MAYTLGGQLLTIDTITPVSVTEDSGTLGSGQQYTSKVPASGTVRAGVVFCHAAGGNETTMTDPGVIDTATTYLAARGFPCVAGRLSGDNWGNDQSRTDVDELIAELDDLGADITKVAFIGLSMGDTTAFSWISDGNLASTLCVASIVGVASTQDFYDNRGGEASIDTAYGGAAAWTAAQPTHDPTPLAAAGAFDGLPCKFWYGALDTTCPPELTEALAADIGSTAILVEGPGDHFGTAGTTDPYAVASFIIGQYAPTARARKLVT